MSSSYVVGSRTTSSAGVNQRETRGAVNQRDRGGSVNQRDRGGSVNQADEGGAGSAWSRAGATSTTASEIVESHPARTLRREQVPCQPAPRVPRSERVAPAGHDRHVRRSRTAA